MVSWRRDPAQSPRRVGGRERDAASKGGWGEPLIHGSATGGQKAGMETLSGGGLRFVHLPKVAGAGRKAGPRLTRDQSPARCGAISIAKRPRAP